MQKTKKLIFFGDQDNIGIQLCLRARAHGIRSFLYLMNEGRNRSDPRDFDPNIELQALDWIFSGPEAFKLGIQQLNSLQHVLVGSSGIELQYTLQYQSRHPVFFVPTGSDLNMWPFVTPETALLKNYLDYKKIIWKNRERISHVFDCSYKGHHSCQLLGIYPKHNTWLYPLPIQRLLETEKEAPSSDFIRQLMNDVRHRHSQYILFLPTRKNADPTRNIYKGSEKLLQAIFDFYRQNPTRLSKEISIINVEFSNVESPGGGKDFSTRLKSFCNDLGIGLTSYKRLKRYQVWSLLTLPQVVVLDTFPDFPDLILGGTARETLFMGRPLITGDVGKNDCYGKALYGSDVPLYYASTVPEIVEALNTVIQSQPSAARSQKLRNWALERFNDQVAFDYVLRTIGAL